MLWAPIEGEDAIELLMILDHFGKRLLRLGGAPAGLLRALLGSRRREGQTHTQNQESDHETSEIGAM